MIRRTEFLRKEITRIPNIANQNSNFLTLQTSEFQKKNPTRIFRIKHRIRIPLTMGVPEIGTENWNSQPSWKCNTTPNVLISPSGTAGPRRQVVLAEGAWCQRKVRYIRRRSDGGIFHGDGEAEGTAHAWEGGSNNCLGPTVPAFSQSRAATHALPPHVATFALGLGCVQAHHKSGAAAAP
jgi:hypothetical protein